MLSLPSSCYYYQIWWTEVYTYRYFWETNLPVNHSVWWQLVGNGSTLCHHAGFLTLHRRTFMFLDTVLCSSFLVITALQPLSNGITGDEAHTLQNKAQLCCSMSDMPWGPMSWDMSSDRSPDMYNRRPFLWWAKNYNGRQILSVGRHVGCVS